MSRGRSRSGALLFALFVPALGSCVADSVSIRVMRNVAPEDDCTYTESGLSMPGGQLNLDVNSSADSYYATLLVANGLKPRARDVPPQSEPNGVTVNELEIEVTDSAGRLPSLPSSLPNPFTVSASGQVEPEGEGLIGVDLLPRPYVSALKALNMTSDRIGSLRLSVIVRGRTWGDVPVESGTWLWTIQLVSASQIYDDKQCIVFQDDICQIGQDFAVYACHPSTVPDDVM